MTNQARSVDVLEDQLTADPLYGSAVAFVLARMPDLQRATVLEIGCGRGQMCALFASKGATVVGVDLNADVLLDANRAATSLSVPRQCHFIRGTAESIPLSDSCADVVYSRSTLQYMDHQTALREIQRVLKPGGTLVLIENLPFNPIILLYRLGRRVTSRDGRRREYVRSIRGYLTFRELDAIGESFLHGQRRHFHLTRMLSLAPLRPPFVPEALDDLLARLDGFMLSHIAPARRLAWFIATVYVGLRKET